MKCSDNNSDNNPIFCQPDGGYYSPDRLGARVAKTMKKAGLNGVSLHSLRHSHASILLSKGVPAPAVFPAARARRPEPHAPDLQLCVAGRQPDGRQNLGGLDFRGDHERASLGEFPAGVRDRGGLRLITCPEGGRPGHDIRSSGLSDR